MRKRFLRWRNRSDRALKSSVPKRSAGFPLPALARGAAGRCAENVSFRKGCISYEELHFFVSCQSLFRQGLRLGVSGLPDPAYNTVMLAYDGSVRKNGIYDEVAGILAAEGKTAADFILAVGKAAASCNLAPGSCRKMCHAEIARIFQEAV